MNELLKDQNVLRQIIMEHYQRPCNKGLIEGYPEIHMASESCIDDLHVQLLLEDGVVKDVRFDGVACTISTSSTSIMSELLKGKSVDEANKIIDEYYKMINQEEYDADMLEEAYAFHTVYKQANRIKCATIGIDGMKELLNKHE